jgi:hypothetical protein
MTSGAEPKEIEQYSGNDWKLINASTIIARCDDRGTIRELLNQDLLSTADPAAPRQSSPCLTVFRRDFVDLSSPSIVSVMISSQGDIDCRYLSSTIGSGTRSLGKDDGKGKNRRYSLTGSTIGNNDIADIHDSRCLSASLTEFQLFNSADSEEDSLLHDSEVANDSAVLAYDSSIDDLRKVSII